MDLKQRFELTDEHKTTLTEENCPKGSRFVSAKNRMYEIVAWEQTGSGSPRVYLRQGNEGSDNFDEGSAEVHRDVVSTIDVLRIPSEPIVPEVLDDLGMGDDLDADLEETTGADVPDDDVDDDMAAVTEDEPAATAAPVAETVDEEFVAENVDIPAAEEAAAPEAAEADDDMEETAGDAPAVDPEPAPVPEIDDEFEPISATEPATEAEQQPTAGEVPQSAAPALKTAWDGKQGCPSGVIMARATQGLTVAEIAQECLDKALYTEITKARSNVMRTVRKLSTQGYGVMFLGDQDDPDTCRVHLTRDGVNAFVPEFIPDSPDPAGILGAQIRQRMGIRDISDLPPQLAAALAGIEPNELGLTPNQYQGVVLVSLGMALMLGGKI